MTRLIRIAILTVAAVALLRPAVAHADPAVAAGHSLDAAAQLAPGQTVNGTLDATAGANWYQVQVTQTPVTLTVTAAHTNDVCQVFVRVQNIDGLTLAQASLLGDLPQKLNAQPPVEGPYFLIVDAGPYADCSGSTYQLSATLTVPPFAKSARPNERQHAASPQIAGAWCDYYTTRASALSVLIRRTTAALRRSHGARHRRLAKKLHNAKLGHHAARTEQQHWCGLVAR